MNAQVSGWLDGATLAAARRWAERAVQADRVPLPAPNAVLAFSRKHAIPLDHPRTAGEAILRVLASLDQKGISHDGHDDEW
jgi:hypothetical protein